MKFKLWLLENDVSDYDKVANYARHLAEEPSVQLDDAMTLLNVLKRNLKKYDPEYRFNAFSDYQPLVRKVFDKLSTEDKSEADKALHNMFDDDTFRHPMAIRGYTNPQVNLQELENIIHTIIDRDYSPIVVQRFLDKYGDVYKHVNENLKREFISWFQDKIKRTGNTKTLSEILAELFKKMEPEE